MTNLRQEDLMLEIPRGTFPGVTSVNKFGANADIGSGTTEDVWDGGGTYSFPSTADITHLSQAVNQTAMRGETIEVQGLNASWELTVQTKALDASDSTTAVELDTPLIRIFRMKVLADVVTDQDISAKNVGAGTTYATIGAGNNQTLMALYTVPSGKTAYMTSYFYDGVEATGKEPKSTEFKLWVADRDNGYEFQLKHEKGVSKGDSGGQHLFFPYMKINAKNDIKLTASPNSEDASVHGGFDLILVDD
ncbi:MAG: hypothetical protein KOO63_08265 [Bacteroidales bacterium]|nr:hypothetical protein [Candidatus Latescibacterota bacterium]